MSTPAGKPPEYPTNHPPDRVWQRTTVGARPHVVDVAAVAVAAADDVDGAGGVDHGRVPISRSPFRLGRAARPGDTCGRRASPAGGTDRNHARAAATQGAGRAIDTARRGRAMGGRMLPRDARARRRTQMNTNAKMAGTRLKLEIMLT